MVATLMGLSQAAFAKTRGVTRKTATMWKRRGLLVFHPDGSVDAERSNALLDARPTCYRGGTIAGAGTPTDMAEGAVEATADIRTMSDALLRKEAALARLRELEFDRESGAVVEVSRVQAETAAGNARVRIKLLGISAKLAPHVSSDVRTLIDHEIRQALEELSEYDDAGNLISPEAAA
jgi:hypothetical protein